MKTLIRIILVMLALITTSCSHYDKANKTMWGIGAYKDSDVEQSADAPKFSLF